MVENCKGIRKWAEGYLNEVSMRESYGCLCVIKISDKEMFSHVLNCNNNDNMEILHSN